MLCQSCPSQNMGHSKNMRFVFCSLCLTRSVRHLFGGTIQALFSLPGKRRMNVNFQCDFQYITVHIKVK